jgi:cephalosporin-C deacetylase
VIRRSSRAQIGRGSGYPVEKLEGARFVAQSDLPVDVLRVYAPALPVPDDLEAFWADTLDSARQHDLSVTCTPVDNGLAVIETFDVTYAGYGGSPIRAWLHLPAARSGRLPAVVEYIGYGGGRGLPHEQVLWAAAGYAHLLMDTRGQGSSWRVGDTPDPDAGGAPFHPGFMTQGILDPATYYYRRVFTDAVPSPMPSGRSRRPARSIPSIRRASP